MANSMFLKITIWKNVENYYESVHNV